MIIASIDIGTNTVLLLIVDVNIQQKKFKTILNEQRIPRIGKGLQSGKEISKERILLLLKVLQEYQQIIKKYNCEKVLVTATNALRIASNQKQITNLIKGEFGFETKVVSGEEEAQLSFLGAAGKDNDKKSLMIDIGGGSTEITFGKGNQILFNKSFNAGVVSGTENYLIDDPPAKFQINEFTSQLETTFKEFSNTNNFDPDEVIAIAGTPTTLACIQQNLTKYNEEKIEGSILKKNDVKLLVDDLSNMSSFDIKDKYKAVVSGREDVLLAGTIILFKLMEILNIDSVKVSTKGIRFGAVEKYLADNFRD